MIAIKTRNLTRNFGKVKAVQNLDLRIKQSSLFGLIGPNGAGKTTTLRMLAGLLEPTSGEIRINDLPADRFLHELHWQIGYMPDFFGVYEDLLVWEYLDFYARCYKLPPSRRQKVIYELLELVDLTEKRDAFVQTLSRGMRQRLCLAHTLVHDPSILILDEPASGLDPRARVEMRELLRELRSMGKTIVLSSHILSELAELCDAVGIMEKGSLIASGPLDEIHKLVHTNRTIRIQMVGNPIEVESLLKSHSNVIHIYSVESNENKSSLEFDFSGNEEAMADLFQTIIANRIRVVSFSEASTDLEEIFLGLTKGEVS